MLVCPLAGLLTKLSTNFGTLFGVGGTVRLARNDHILVVNANHDADPRF